ncbi:MAG: outer membrane beta-barrel protein [Bacteroidetes bacterium]|nr:outer membrane beta-barrel protein [Bacteroidota bacterium]
MIFHRVKILLIFLLLLIIREETYAQDCQMILDQARQHYGLGHFSEALNVMKTCHPDKSDPQLQWQVARMEALCYLALKETEKAKKAGIRMLELNPRYEPNNLDDPAELIRLLESIPVISRFSIGLNFSPWTNCSFPEIRSVYTLNDMDKTYTGKNGYLLGLKGIYNINQHFGFQLSANALQKQYDLKYHFDQWSFQMKESSTYLNTPLVLNYTINPGKKLRFYGNLGVYSSYLLQGESSFSANNSEFQKSYSIEKVSTLTRRNKWDYGLNGGLGMVYAQRNGQLSLEVAYMHSLKNINNTQTRYEFTRLMGDYFYLEDDLRLHYLSLQLSYVQYLNFRVIK